MSHAHGHALDLARELLPVIWPEVDGRTSCRTRRRVRARRVRPWTKSKWATVASARGDGCSRSDKAQVSAPKRRSIFAPGHGRRSGAARARRPCPRVVAIRHPPLRRLFPKIVVPRRTRKCSPFLRFMRGVALSLALHEGRAAVDRALRRPCCLGLPVDALGWFAC